MGGMPMLNHAVNGATPGRVNTDEQETSDNIPRLNAYIYDFFLGQEMWDCARAMQKNRVNMDPEPGNAEDQMNGTDSKDAGDSKKPHDLPASRVGGSQGAFLLEWFDLFWDIFEAQRRRPQPGQIPNNASRYIEHNTVRLVVRAGCIRGLTHRAGGPEDEAREPSRDAEKPCHEPDGFTATHATPGRYANEWR